VITFAEIRNLIAWAVGWSMLRFITMQWRASSHIARASSMRVGAASDDKRHPGITHCIIYDISASKL